VLGRFYAAVRKATPQIGVMAERYGGDVSFNFDSNGRSVWVMALVGRDAPPLTLLRLGSGQASSRRDRPSRRPYGAPQRERSLAFETTLRASSGRAGEQTGLLWMMSKRRGVTRRRMGEAKVG